MTQNTIINGLPYSQLADPLTAYEDRKRAEAAAVDSRVVARFSTVAIRDSTYAAWTAQGGVLVDGMMCSVAGKPMIYRSGSWRGIQNEPPVYRTATRQLPLSRTDGVEDSWFAETIADPGFPYRLRAQGQAYTFAASCVCTVQIRAGNGAPDNQLPIIAAVSNGGNNTTGLDLLTRVAHTDVLTGPSRLIGYAVRAGSTGSWSITIASMTYQIEPA